MPTELTPRERQMQRTLYNVRELLHRMQGRPTMMDSDDSADLCDSVELIDKELERDPAALRELEDYAAMIIELRDELRQVNERRTSQDAEIAARDQALSQLGTVLNELRVRVVLTEEHDQMDHKAGEDIANCGLCVLLDKHSRPWRPPMDDKRPDSLTVYRVENGYRVMVYIPDPTNEEPYQTRSVEYVARDGEQLLEVIDKVMPLNLKEG